MTRAQAEKAKKVEKTEKKRGAPKGVKRGPRQLFYILQGIKDEAPFMDQIPADNAEEAATKFSELHGIEVVGKVLGAFYEQKGKGSSKSSTTIDIETMKFTGQTKIGQHKGWNVKVLIAEDPAVCFAVYTTSIDPNENKSKRSKPQPKPLPLREIENLQDA